LHRLATQLLATQSRPFWPAVKMKVSK
jgi:hypothetical protein